MSNGEEGQQGQPAEQEQQQGQSPEQQQAITVGSAIVATTTIDALFTAAFATRSADLAATPTYTWAAINPWPSITATWAAANVPATMMTCTFQVRNNGPASANSGSSSVLP